MKRNLRIIALVLLIVNLVCSFMPYYFTMKVKKAVDSWSGIYSDYDRISYNIIEIIDAPGYEGSTASVVIVLMWGILIVSILISIFLNKDTKVLNFLPAVSLIPFLVVIRSMANFYQFKGNFHYAVDVNWMFYISLALQGVAAVLMIFSNKTEALPQAAAVPSPNALDMGNVVKSVNTIEEIKKYKALLDEGIITQEEYDAKKKQLLSL